MTEIDSAQAPPRKHLLMLACLLGILWLAILLWMSLTFSNPVTLNRTQIQNSEFVVRGEFAAKSGKFSINESWPPDALVKELRFANYQDLPARAGHEYLVPVVEVSNEFYVTPSPLKGAPLIYEFSEPALHQLEEILKTR